MGVNIETVIKNLNKNGMKAMFVKSKEEALELSKTFVEAKSVVACGGSVSLDECGIRSYFKSSDYEFLDQYEDGLTHEDRAEIYYKSINADVYFTSSNAITEDGVLYNVDGRANRIVAMTFGAKKVVVVAGINKLVKTLDEAVDRVRRIAAPLNCVRLKKNTYCSKFGVCEAIKDGKKADTLYAGCNSPDKICRNFIFTGSQLIKDRIIVILVDEKLGY